MEDGYSMATVISLSKLTMSRDLCYIRLDLFTYLKI
ncbi:hypothetical protein SPLC1_S260490 [Arthrospira platensis C1]|nr:hypothetical protein SPLC1_S260490 [Arthrospira platensis C1]